MSPFQELVARYVEGAIEVEELESGLDALLVSDPEALDRKERRRAATYATADAILKEMYAPREQIETTPARPSTYRIMASGPRQATDGQPTRSP